MPTRFPLWIMVKIFWYGSGQQGLLTSGQAEILIRRLEATRNPTRAAAEMSDESGNGVIRPLRDNEKAPEFPGLSHAGFSRRNLQSQKMPPVGLEATLSRSRFMLKPPEFCGILVISTTLAITLF